MDAIQRVPPNSLESEKALLGAVLQDNRAYQGQVPPGAFYRGGHRLLWATIGDMIANGDTADPLTVSERLKENGSIEKCGGASYVSSLAGSCPSVAHAPNYAAEVLRQHSRRLAISSAMEIVDAAYGLAPVDELCARLHRAGNEITPKSSRLQPIRELLKEVVADLERLSQQEELPGLSTGFSDLDRITRLQPGEMTVVAGRPGMGKAQPINAPVLMSDGKWRPIGRLNVGDSVASIDGEPSFVTGVFPRGEREVFKVRFSDGREAECCDEHLWKVYCRHWPEPRILQLKDIRSLLTKKRYQKRVWVDLPSGEFGGSDHLPLDPWFLGVLIGNGNMTNGTPIVTTIDAETIYRVTKVAESMEAHVTHDGIYGYRIVGNSHGFNPVTRALQDLDLWGRRSEEKHIPSIYLSAKKDVRLALLRGLIDTDGWVETSGSVRFSTSSSVLAEGVAALVRSLGGLCKIKEKDPFYIYKNERRNGLKHYVCKIRHSEPESLVQLHRKRRRARNNNGTPRLCLKEVVPSRLADTACITVSHASKLYITTEYTVTHNSAFAMDISRAALFDQKKVFWASLEMTRHRLTKRLLSSLSGIEGSVFRSARFRDQDWGALSHALGRLVETKLWIDDTPGMGSGHIRTAAHGIAAEWGGLDMIVVDYVQLMNEPGSWNGQKRLEVAQSSHNMISLAKELNAHVVLLSQLGRQVDARKPQIPQISDLKEAGDLEQDADNIFLLYREEYYRKEDTPEDKKGLGEIHVGKCRDGETGCIEVLWQGNITSYRPFEKYR